MTHRSCVLRASACLCRAYSFGVAMDAVVGLVEWLSIVEIFRELASSEGTTQSWTASSVTFERFFPVWAVGNLFLQQSLATLLWSWRWNDFLERTWNTQSALGRDSTGRLVFGDWVEYSPNLLCTWAIIRLQQIASQLKSSPWFKDRAFCIPKFKGLF